MLKLVCESVGEIVKELREVNTLEQKHFIIAETY